MNLLKIALVTVILAVCCNLNLADDDQQLPAAKRIALRRPVGKTAKLSTTTTTTTPATNSDNEDGDYNDENQDAQYADELDEQQSSTTTTTTEAPKKIGPVIRPFRSNNDFLNSLKRRQENAKKNRAEKATIKPNKPIHDADHGNHDDDDAAHSPTQVTTKNYKTNNSALSRRKYTKPTKQEYPIEDSEGETSEQQQKEEIKPKRTLGRLALRKHSTN